MPELPDVEGFRRYFARHARGSLVEAVEAPDRVLVRNRTPQALGRAIGDQRFEAPARHGKWLIAPIGGQEVLMHFGMTGFLRWSSDRDGRQGRHEKALAGWTVFLDLNANESLDSDEARTRTDADGRYSFQDLAPGAYIVRPLAKVRWEALLSLHTIALTSGESAAGQDFPHRRF